MASAPFWIALICQIIIVIGYFWFYRKEQLCTLPLHTTQFLSPMLTALFSQRDHNWLLTSSRCSCWVRFCILWILPSLLLVLSPSLDFRVLVSFAPHRTLATSLS